MHRDYSNNSSFLFSLTADPLDYLLVDEESEARFSFSLSLTLQQAKLRALLTGYSVHSTPNVKPPPQDIASQYLFSSNNLSMYV